MAQPECVWWRDNFFLYSGADGSVRHLTDKWLSRAAPNHLEKPGHDFWTEAEASFMSELHLLPEVHTRTLGGGL